MSDETEKKRRKPAESRKDDSIRIRVSEAQKAKLVSAAERAGLGVSSWLLSIGLREADRKDRKGRLELPISEPTT